MRPVQKPDSAASTRGKAISHGHSGLHIATLLALSCSVLAPTTATLAAESVVGVVQLQHRPAEEIAAAVTPLLENGEAISSDGFRVIVKSTPSRQQALGQLIEQLDKPMQNLLISVLQNSKISADELNAEIGLSSSSAAGTRMYGMVGDTRDLERHRTLQQLRTVEGQAAHIETGTLRPVEQPSTYNLGYGYPGFGLSTQLQQAGTGFAVLPQLTGKREVLVYISPWSDRFLNRAGLTIQNAQTTLKARLGEWIELSANGYPQQTHKQKFQGLNHSTGQQDSHTLIKIDLAN